MNRTKTTIIPVMLMLLSCVAGTARGEITALNDDDLSAVWGQSLLEFQNTSYLGYDFSRFTLNADIEVSANLGGIAAGSYEGGVFNSQSSESLAIDVGTLQLGRSDSSEAQRLVNLSNPYLELAYDDIESDSNRRLVGMRLGFEGVQGDIGIAMTALTGAVKIDLGGGLALDTLVSDPAPELPLLIEIGALHAGNAQGPSRDFFVSVLSEPLVYPNLSGTAAPAAMPGLWINWRDRLSGVLGTTPPNNSK